MAAPYDYNNGYTADPVQRAPSPYQQQNAPNDYYNQHPQQFDPAVQHGQPSPYSEGPTPATDGPEAERGILGALGGGVAGGYTGHQTCHGFLGTVGGAIVGSLTEDWARKKSRSRPCSPKPPQCDPPGPVCRPPSPACTPGYGHHPHPGDHHGMYSPPMVHAQTTTNTHVDVQPGMMHHQPHYPTHPHPPVYHPQPPQNPVKPCGHQHTCACKWLGKY